MGSELWIPHDRNDHCAERATSTVPQWETSGGSCRLTDWNPQSKGYTA